MEDRQPIDEPASTATDARQRGLIVQTGRGVGTCLTVRGAVALVGRAPACDIRVESADVRSLHCLLSPGPNGVTLRALHTDGARLNGRVVTTAHLRDGDVLQIGPVEYRLCWTADRASPGQPHVEALRIQAAAVVAQQAVLFEREIGLVGREEALARQEEQVAEHLETKRRQLLELQDQITDARASLREKRAAYAAMVDQQRQDNQAAREAAAELQRDAKAERQRLIELRQRMIRRWRRHWTAQRKAGEVAAAAVARQKTRLEEKEKTFAERMARFNTFAELEQRRLREAAERLLADENEARARNAKATREHVEENRTLARRAKAVAAEERRIASERQRFDRDLADRQREFEHLETRIGNARWQLLAHQQEMAAVAKPETPPAAAALAIPARSIAGTGPDYRLPELSDPSHRLNERSQTLARVAGDLSDQRLMLAEQAQRIVMAQAEWFAEREAAVQELIELGESFGQREHDLVVRAQAVAASEEHAHRERAEIGRARVRMEAERIRGEAQVAGLRIDLDHRAAELAVRENRLIRMREILKDLAMRCGRRLRQEVDALRIARRACAQERMEWAAARAIWLRADVRAQEDCMAAAAKALAFEETRKQLLAAIDRPAAAKRIERLKRQWTAYLSGTVRDLGRLRATLAAQSTRLDEQAARVDQMTQAAVDREAENAAIRMDLDRQSVELAADRVRWDQRLAQAQAANQRAEQRAIEMRDDVDRLARLLIDDGPETSIDRAA